MLFKKTFALFLTNKRTLFIRNSAGSNSIQTPCVKCKYFVWPEESPDPYDPKPDLKLGKCSLFGEQNVVTGQVVHDFALHCRMDNKKCDYSGKYFKPTD